MSAETGPYADAYTHSYPDSKTDPNADTQPDETSFGLPIHRPRRHSVLHGGPHPDVVVQSRTASKDGRRLYDQALQRRYCDGQPFQVFAKADANANADTDAYPNSNAYSDASRALSDSVREIVSEQMASGLRRVHQGRDPELHAGKQPSAGR